MSHFPMSHVIHRHVTHIHRHQRKRGLKNCDERGTKARIHCSAVYRSCLQCVAVQCDAVPAEERAKMLGPARQKRTKLVFRDTAVAVCVCVCVCSSASAESSVDKTFFGPFGSLRIRTRLAHHRLRNLLLKHSMLRCVAVCCSALQCVAVSCSVLRCVAVC